MLHYKDRTFCPFKRCAKFDTCPDALTDRVRQDAARWWGDDNVPISVYMDRPECFEVREDA